MAFTKDKLSTAWKRQLKTWLIFQLPIYLRPRRGGRVVDCGGLENRCAVRYRGFESYPLRTYSVQVTALQFIISQLCLPCAKREAFTPRAFLGNGLEFLEGISPETTKKEILHD